MTDFLGREDCIESLRRDLVDLQGAILDVFSRTGPVRFSSWKFPDKLSCNLDMVALLDQYDFIHGDDTFNQYSHIVLLELVIDRLLLLLQSFNVFVEQVPNSFKAIQTQEKGFVPLGLVVRNYWSKLVTYKTSYKKQTLCGDVLSSFEPRREHCSSAESSPGAMSSWSQDPSVPSPAPHTPAADTRHVASQTLESCLVPCDACYRTQCALRRTGASLVELCRSEGLPSSLRPLSEAVQDTVEAGRMTAADIGQWGAEELRDMRRLAKHLQDVRATVEPLKDRSAAVEKENKVLMSDVKRLREELKETVEKHQTISVQLEFSQQKAQRYEIETQQRQREIVSLEERNSSLMEKVAVQLDTSKALETENNSLQEKIRQLQEEKESCSHQLQKETQKLQADIAELQLCLQKEKDKYISACRQQASMQAKQKYLAEQVDGLDEECEELQGQLAEREERQIELHCQIQQMSEDSEQLQAKLNQQQDSFKKLEKDKEALRTKNSDLENTVAELKQKIIDCAERKRLLVAFPDLNPQTQPQSTGSVTLDMEQQFKANCIRIQVLEQENITLYCSLLKLKERSQINDEPLELWNGSPRVEEYQSQERVLSSGSAKGHLQNSKSKEAEGGNGLKSGESEDRNSASSLSSVQLYFQTLQRHASSAKSRKHRSYQPRKKSNHYKSFPDSVEKVGGSSPQGHYARRSLLDTSRVGHCVLSSSEIGLQLLRSPH